MPGHGRHTAHGQGQERGARVARVLLVTGLLNLLVLVAKLWVGLSTGSLSVLADAVHSGSDLANNVIGLWVVRASHKPPDREHPYGHRKFESLAVFVLAMALTVLAFELLTTALRGSAAPDSSPEALGIMVGVLLVNIAVTWFEHRAARRLGSSFLGADARHTLSDVLVTIAVIGGWQLAIHGVLWADRAAAGGVAIVVCVLAYGLFRSAVPILVDAAALEPNDVRRVAASIEGVRRVMRVRSRWIGDQAAVELTLGVAAHLSTEDGHRIADQVEHAIELQLGVLDTTIHLEPERESGD